MMLKYDPKPIIVLANPPLNCLSVLAWLSLIFILRPPPFHPPPSYLHISLSSSGYFCLSICLCETHMQTLIKFFFIHKRTNTDTPPKSLKDLRLISQPQVPIDVIICNVPLYVISSQLILSLSNSSIIIA